MSVLLSGGGDDRSSHRVAVHPIAESVAKVDLASDHDGRAFRRLSSGLQDALARYSSIASSGTWAIPLTVT